VSWLLKLLNKPSQSQQDACRRDEQTLTRHWKGVSTKILSRAFSISGPIFTPWRSLPWISVKLITCLQTLFLSKRTCRSGSGVPQSTLFIAQQCRPVGVRGFLLLIAAWADPCFPCSDPVPMSRGEPNYCISSWYCATSCTNWLLTCQRGDGESAMLGVKKPIGACR